MKTQLGLILSTLALTVLIWTYADHAGHGIITLVVPVTLVPADPGSPLVFTMADAPEDEPDRNVQQIKMTFRGPNRAIADLKGEHEYGGFGMTVKLDDEELTPGPHSRDLLPDLSEDPGLLKRGLTLDSISPRDVKFNVDRYQTVRLKLIPNAGTFEDHLDGRPLLDPDQVDANVLQSRLGGQLPPSTLTLPLEDLIDEALDRQAAETEGALTLTLTVPLSSPPGMSAILLPDRVRAIVKLKARTTVERITVRPLGVNIKTQDFFKQGWEIEWRDESGAQFTVPVNVRVPLTKLAALRQLDTSLIDAYVVIDADDLLEESGAGPAGPVPATAASETGAYSSRQVQFKFPPGFEDVRPEPPLPTVKLRVKKKAGPPDLVIPPSLE